MRRNTTDVRSKRTRKAILTAFNGMVLGGAEKVPNPTAVAAAAKVGRSTLYEHFGGIDEVLAKGIESLFEALARESMQLNTGAGLSKIVEHCWQNRKLAATILGGTGHNKLSTVLAEAYRKSLVECCGSTRPKLPTVLIKLVPSALAEGTLGLLRQWVNGRLMADPAEVAAAIHATASAVVATHLQCVTALRQR